MSDTDTPEAGALNGDQSLKTYGHTFKTLSFGAIEVNNPHITILPNAIGRNLSKAQLTGDRTKSEKDLFDVPDMVIGMNVLRKLHIYLATKENKMYISQAAAPTPEETASWATMHMSLGRNFYRQYAAAQIRNADATLAANPQDAKALNQRCFMRGVLKTDLDKAMNDCEQSLKLLPGNEDVLDSKAFILYQQGKFPDALQAYNAVLAINTSKASSLFMRGYTKGRLGDAAGKDADTAAATKIQPGILHISQLNGVAD
jgi:tetratricopeptide (TPR) repeat protein